MNQIKNFTRKFIRGLLKFILYAFLLLLFLLGSIIIALQFPYVQTKVVNKATSYISEKIHYPIHIEGIDIHWFDEIVLKGVSAYDLHKGKMIYLGEAIVDFQIISIPQGKFNIDKITLKDGEVNMIRHAPDGAINLTQFIEALQSLSAPSEKKEKPSPFIIDEVELDNMYFSYSDLRKPHLKDIFDHNYFSFDSIYADASDLKIIADTFQVDISRLETIEPNINIKVHELTTLYTITGKNMTFDKLEANIGNSLVKDYLRFNYNDIDDLSDFNEKTIVETNLKNARVSFDDLEKFAPELKAFNETATLTANAKGRVVNFMVKDMQLAFGKHSQINGQVSFNGLPDFFETFIDFNFNRSTVYASDLKQYISDPSANLVLKKFEKINGTGAFTGFPQDFVTKGTFQTNLGRLDSDIRLDAKKKNAKPEYEGNLKTYAFNLGKLMDLENHVQLVDMDGKLDGSGFSLEDAEVNLKADISRLGINNYNYRNIKTNARFSGKTFNGFLSIKDSNVVFEAKGKLDLTKNKEIFDIDAHLEKANLKPLHLSDVEALVRTDLELNFTGTHIDEIVGTADFKNTYLLFNKSREIYIDSLFAFSSLIENNRTVELRSDLLTLKASGNFNYTSLYDDVTRLYDEYKLNITNDKTALNNYYSKKGSINYSKYEVDFDIHIKNLNSIFEYYAPGLYLSRGLTIQGNFLHGKNSILNVNTHIDTLYYKGNELYNSNVDISTSKLADSSNVLAMVNINSGRQKLSGLPETGNFAFEGIWDKNTSNFTTKIQQLNSTNKINLTGDFFFLDNNKKQLSFGPSTLEFLNKKWTISPDNKIFFAKNEIGFENFIISNKEQYVQLNGILSDNSDKVVELKIGNLNLQIVNSLLPGYNLGGTLNSKILIKDIYHDLDLTGDMRIDQFVLDNFLLGNVKGKSRWDHEQNKLLLDVQLERNNLVTVDLEGYILPKTESKSEEINMIASLDNADLEIFSPIVKGVLSDLSGKATGEFEIKGDFKDLNIRGKGDVKKGKFKIDYLGTTYFFDDAIYLEDNYIGLRKLKINDEFGNTGTITGGITHDGFKNFIVDLSGKANQLNVLNTNEKDNNLFYGNAFVTGDFSILGPFENLEITGNAISNKGTKIFIPLNTYESGMERQSFITFVNKKKSKRENISSDTIDLSGVKLDFNFEITPDAYAEIIFDKRTGDIIRGYGNGNIKMTIDTRGDFNMFGNYRIAKGAYNYTLAGLISKEFKLEKNSSITWTGDPYGGILDVKAYFESKVPITPLIEPTDSLRRKQELGRTHLTKVLLDIQGDLMSPHIGLDIDITPTTAIGTEIATEFEANIKRNEQELNRQVFSLLVLGAFSPENSFSGVGGSASNVSQLLTNQLGNWLSQVDENLVIDIDLNGLDKEALNTFNLRMSYTLLDGRLRISRDGSFTNLQNTNQTTQQSLGNIAGEWTVEYLLSKEGKFRLKLYNRNNQNQLMNTYSTNNYTTTGFSIFHTQSFNSINDLLGIKKKQKESPPANKKSDKNDEINFAPASKKDEEDESK